MHKVYYRWSGIEANGVHEYRTVWFKALANQVYVKRYMKQAQNSMYNSRNTCCIIGSIRIYILMTGRLEVVSNETN